MFPLEPFLSDILSTEQIPLHSRVDPSNVRRQPDMNTQVASLQELPVSSQQTQLPGITYPHLYTYSTLQLPQGNFHQQPTIQELCHLFTDSSFSITSTNYPTWLWDIAFGVMREQASVACGDRGRQELLILDRGKLALASPHSANRTQILSKPHHWLNPWSQEAMDFQ